MRVIYLVALFFFTTAIDAQQYYWREVRVDADQEAQRIRLLFQSKDQLVWLGTDQGLFAFDGIHFKYIQRHDAQHVDVTCIAQHPNGDIWVGYEDGVVVRASLRGVIHTLPVDSIAGFAVTGIEFLSDSVVFIATYGHGLWKLNDRILKKFSPESGDAINDIYDMMTDHYGKLWLATDHGIWTFKPSTSKYDNINRDDGLPDEIVTKLSSHKSGDVWIGFYDKGIGKYLAHNKSISIPPDQAAITGPVTSLQQGHHGDLWYATEKQIVHMDIARSGREITLPPSFQDRIEDILLDHLGNLWITAGDRIWIANTRLEHIQPGVNGIQCIVPSRGHLWLGCESGLYSIEVGQPNSIRHLPAKDLNILSIFADHKGCIWMGTFGDGLFIYDPDSGQLINKNESHGISNNSILNIDGIENRVWLTTLGGVTEIEWKENPVVHPLSITDFKNKYNLPAGYVYDVFVDHEGTVWFATDGMGLYFLKGDDLHAFEIKPENESDDTLAISTIYSVTRGGNKGIWISGEGGQILKLSDQGEILEKFTSTHKSVNSLVAAGVQDIVIAREGVLEINNPVTGRYIFSELNGIKDFSPHINAAAKDLDGSAWIADTDEILHYTSYQRDTSNYVQMHILDQVPGILNQGEIIRLSPDSNYLDLRFSGLWYADPDRINYRYKLEGHDIDWIYTKEGRAVYSRLSPGTYTFLVEGSFNDDFSKSKALSRSVVVMPPFYQTWWFIMGAVLVIGTIVFLYVRERISRLNRFHQLEKEKTVLQLNAIQAQVNPHFLFNSFNTLSGIIEEDQKAAVEYVDELSGFFRGVLLHRDEELITVSEEIRIMHNYIYILKKRHEDKINVTEHITSTEGYIVPLTIQLLIENALKHNKITKDNPLPIDVTIDAKYLTVINPIRMKIQGLTESTGFGLSSLKTRYSYLTQEAIKIVNDGNTFTVQIPIIHPKQHP